MKRVYYVQRLNAPIGVINPFSFGGGLIDGGFAPDAMKILRDIISFDYMGSAEFEWGAVPTAFKSLFEDKTITKDEFKIGDKNLYVICSSIIKNDVIEWIKQSAIESPQLKERLCLKQTLEGHPYNDYKGWIKIEDDKYCSEPFMFFIDKQMFDNVCKLFGI